MELNSSVAAVVTGGASGLGEATVRALAAKGRLLEGAFRPGGHAQEWCDPSVLESVRRRSLAKLRKEVEPVEPHVLARLMLTWQGVTRRRKGLDALLDTVERLQGAPLLASVFEDGVLSSRLESYSADGLDRLAAAGEEWGRAGKILSDVGQADQTTCATRCSNGLALDNIKVGGHQCKTKCSRPWPDCSP